MYTTKVDKHAPLKKRHLRGNQVSFMTKENSKAIMTVYVIDIIKRKPSITGMLIKSNVIYVQAYLAKKHETSFCELNFEDQSGNRSFWKAIKPHLTNNGKVTSDNFILYEK